VIGSTPADEKTQHCSVPTNADLNAAYNQENCVEATVAHHDSSEIRDGRAKRSGQQHGGGNRADAHPVQAKRRERTATIVTCDQNHGIHQLHDEGAIVQNPALDQLGSMPSLDCNGTGLGGKEQQEVEQTNRLAIVPKILLEQAVMAEAVFCP